MRQTSNPIRMSTLYRAEGVSGLPLGLNLIHVEFNVEPVLNAAPGNC